MNQFKVRYAFLMLAAAAVPVGCMTAPINSAGQVTQVALSNPISLVSMGTAPGATVTIDFSRINAGSFRTKSNAAMTTADIDVFQIQLVPDSGNPSNYNVPTPVSNVTVWMQPAGAAALTNAPAGTFTDAGVAGQMRFTNVPNGTYRARIRAFADQDNNWSTPGDQKIINKNDPINNDAGAMNNPWSVSNNTVMVTPGNMPAYIPNGPTLSVNLNLLDAMNDPVDVNIAVNNGGGPGAMGGVDL